MIYSANIKTIDYSDGNTNIIVKAYGKPMKSDLAMYENEVNYKKVVQDTRRRLRDKHRRKAIIHNIKVYKFKLAIITLQSRWRGYQVRK